MIAADDSGAVSYPTDLVVDAGVALKWYVGEPFGDEARRLLDPDFALHVPELFFVEFGNILWKKSRLRSPPELTVDDGRAILDLLDLVPMTAHPVAHPLRSAYDLAVGPARSTVYDSCYLALAIALDCRMVTADRRFYNAHRGGEHGRRFLWVADLP